MSPKLIPPNGGREPLNKKEWGEFYQYQFDAAERGNRLRLDQHALSCEQAYIHKTAEDARKKRLRAKLASIAAGNRLGA